MYIGLSVCVDFGAVFEEFDKPILYIARRLSKSERGMSYSLGFEEIYDFELQDSVLY